MNLQIIQKTIEVCVFFIGYISFDSKYLAKWLLFFMRTRFNILLSGIFATVWILVNHEHSKELLNYLDLIYHNRTIKGHSWLVSTPTKIVSIWYIFLKIVQSFIEKKEQI